ncbi:MAG: AmmeMemoRadiSam system protein B [Candidatus Nanoarchaeia archaeon]
MWYPDNKEELEEFIDKAFKQKTKIKNTIHGLIVPHAGYEYSGLIAGKAFALLKNKKIKKAIVLGPSHYVYLNEAATTLEKEWHTPMGPIKIFNNGFTHADINTEHSIKNQVPFLQKLGIQEIMPLMIGQITDKEAASIAKKIAKIKAIYVFSTDLSHFLEYNKAKEKDKKSLELIQKLDFTNINNIDACGIYPLLVFKNLCKIKKYKPHLIEYKNSGDITKDKDSVVGYASFWF